jgi:lyso-ornithine lipid O-acyltransferase
VIAFAAALVWIGCTFALLWLRRSGRLSLAERAHWMHRSCRRVARSFGLALEVDGPLPAAGLITSNHLSYLDILAFAGTMPCIFVSKEEVKSWPVFGRFARFGGTLFLDRTRKTAVGEITQTLQQVLASGLPVVLFPEGTSSDGTGVLPFHASLLEAAIRCEHSFTPAAIGYRVPGGAERDLCYYGDISFLPHLRGMLARPGACMVVRYAAEHLRFADRKAAAKSLREQTLQLRAAMSEPALLTER